MIIKIDNKQNGCWPGRDKEQGYRVYSRVWPRVQHCGITTSLYWCVKFTVTQLYLKCGVVYKEGCIALGNKSYLK